MLDSERRDSIISRIIIQITILSKQKTQTIYFKNLTRTLSIFARLLDICVFNYNNVQS